MHKVDSKINKTLTPLIRTVNGITKTNESLSNLYDTVQKSKNDIPSWFDGNMNQILRYLDDMETALKVARSLTLETKKAGIQKMEGTVKNG